MALYKKKEIYVQNATSLQIMRSVLYHNRNAVKDFVLPFVRCQQNQTLTALHNIIDMLSPVFLSPATAVYICTHTHKYCLQYFILFQR